MLKYLTILSVCALAGCTQPAPPRMVVQPEAVATPTQFSLPAGFSVIEQHQHGYYIRLASPERASVDAIRAITTAVGASFDRIDLCLDAARERGDEYASVIGGKLYDYENDIIKPLK